MEERNVYGDRDLRQLDGYELARLLQSGRAAIYPDRDNILAAVAMNDSLLESMMYAPAFEKSDGPHRALSILKTGPNGLTVSVTAFGSNSEPRTVVRTYHPCDICDTPCHYEGRCTCLVSF